MKTSTTKYNKIRSYAKFIQTQWDTNDSEDEKHTRSLHLKTSPLIMITDAVNRGRMFRPDLSGNTLQVTTGCKHCNKRRDWTVEIILLTVGKGGRCHVMDDELPHPSGLPVCSELLQVLVDGVDGLIHLVHAVLQMTSAPFRQPEVEALWGHARANELTATQQSRTRH
jgi:hypothetical protein